MRAVVTALLAAVLLAALPAAARADGDPPSDVLLTQDVYFPYSPNTVSKPLQKTLNDTVKRAQAAGYAIKIALIGDSGDLGAAAGLIDDPQKYANLLTTEISGVVSGNKAIQHPRVLTVLAAGIGGNNLGDDAGPALGTLIPDPSTGADGLATLAITAVSRLAQADGHPFAALALPSVATVKAGRRKSGGGFPPWLVFGLPVLLLVAVLLVLGRRPHEDVAASIDG